MGTNYYTFTHPKCPCCGRSGDRIHIGKSSSGWNFALRVYPRDEFPEIGIESLDGWKRFLSGREIIDEYGDAVSFDDMIDTITKRKKGLQQSTGDRYRRVEPGDGTFDYCYYEFS